MEVNKKAKVEAEEERKNGLPIFGDLTLNLTLPL
jgi:hypothetical protein